jgi:rRNA-processing protein EBP2
VTEEAEKKASELAKRQRDLKKFGKQVQVAKIQERDKGKRQTLEKIKALKRSKSLLESTKTRTTGWEYSYNRG